MGLNARDWTKRDRAAQKEMGSALNQRRHGTRKAKEREQIGGKGKAEAERKRSKGKRRNEISAGEDEAKKKSGKHHSYLDGS